MKRFFSIPICGILACALMFNMISLSFAADSDRTLYNKYAEIVENVAKKYHADIAIAPYGVFDLENARSLSDFEDVLNAIGKLTISGEDSNSIQVTSTTSGNTCTALANASYGSSYITVKITGNFVTQYDIDYNRQVITSATFSTKSGTAGYTWGTTTQNYTLYDHGGTCLYSAQGNIGLPEGTTWKNASITATFICADDGKITSGVG